MLVSSFVNYNIDAMIIYKIQTSFIQLSVIDAKGDCKQTLTTHMTVMISTKVKVTCLPSILDVGLWDKMRRWKTVILMILTLYRPRLM